MSIHIVPAIPVRFPAAWSWLFDETVPSWVKSHYSPRESWKDKPFSREDAKFFFRGVEELSEIFTDDHSYGRHGKLDYFSHPKYRSAYLLYFLPLQAAKFVTLFQLHAKALRAALDHGRRQGVLRVLDLGAGPGTASFALILELLQAATHSGEELPKIALRWVDTNASAMQDGKRLLEQLCNQFSRLRGKVEIEILKAPWWKGTQGLRQPFSLVLMGHVLNEASGPRLPREIESGSDSEDDEESPEDRQWTRPWQEILSLAEGGGTLIVEPAAKMNSQFLSRLRDSLLGSGLVSREPGSIWGPCPHAQKCPLSAGRDWCHFSVPAHVPGTWFAEISKGLGSERQWLKFSYLWLCSQVEGQLRADPTPANQRLVISDILLGSGATEGPRSRENSALVCEPEKAGRIPVPRISKLKRGDWVKVTPETPAKGRRPVKKLKRR